MLKLGHEGENLLQTGVLYNLLARSFTSDVAELRRVFRHVKDVSKSLQMTHVTHLLAKVEYALEDPLATEGYIRLFEMGIAPPYETTYTCKDNPYRKTLEEADISGFYRAFGMKPRVDLPDHLAAELEFIALLYAKEGYAVLSGDHTNAAICHEARTKFLEEHLSKWVGQFKSEVSHHTEKPLYPLLLELVHSIIAFGSRAQSNPPPE